MPLLAEKSMTASFQDGPGFATTSAYLAAVHYPASVIVRRRLEVVTVPGAAKLLRFRWRIAVLPLMTPGR